ncbi:MAG: hypothetical protein KF801_03715 [Cryobacterium sp.]|nr:hypothetical protein [Cryobacterium sp.]
MGLVKSQEVLAAEQRAREQSAMELMAQGAITVNLSPRQQLAYDGAVRYASEIDARERAHYEQLPAQIVAENQRVIADLNAGKLYLANDRGDASRTIHFASCPSVRHQVDRDLAHRFELEHAGTVEGSWHTGPGNDYVAKWPNLMTLDEVEQLRAYRACQRCNPDTKERQKYVASSPKPSKLTSVTPEHIGREYQTLAGEYLGVLESYVVNRDLIVLHCSERDYRGTHDSLITLLPKQ